ncbi:cupin-like domain-containing protein [Aureococcus anophagefferens]|nr:cupin-like domain-containing protein [Aureococcus anophagefferens]
MQARPPTSRPAGGVVRGGHLDDGEERLALARRGRRPARRDPLRYVFESSVHAKRMQARPPTSRPAGGVVRGGHLDDGEERLGAAGGRRAGPAPLRLRVLGARQAHGSPASDSSPAGGVIRGGHLDDGEERLALARRGRRPARRDPLRYVFESSVHAKRMQARPPTSPAGGVVRGGHLDDGEERLALPAAGRADPLRYVFESSVHAKRMEARPPTSSPAGGVVRGGHLDDGEERLALARRGRRPARRDPLRYVFESSVHVKRMEARPPTSSPAGGVIRVGHLDDGEERLALARRGRRPARRDPLRYVFESSVHVKRMEARPPTSRPPAAWSAAGTSTTAKSDSLLRAAAAGAPDPLRYVFESSVHAPAISTMHVIIRATVLSCAFTFATAAGGVKLNKKAYPVEAVVAIFKDFHPTASEADLAGIALALKGLEASDTSPEAVPSDDAEDADVDGLPGVEDSARHLSEACADSETWHKKGDDKKNCAWVGKKAASRCKAWVKSEGGVLASVACPVACDTCLAICEEAKQDLEETLAEEKQTCAEEKQTCAEEKAALEGPSCADSTTWHQGWKKSKTCAWVGKSPAKRCDKESKSKVLASDACPVACDACPTWAEVTEDLQETCDAAEDEITALEAKLEEAVADKTEAEGEVAALEAANAKLTAELKEAVADKTEAQGNVTTLEAKNAALEAERADAVAAKETCEARICDGLFVDACGAEKYVDGGECTDCPAGHTCDGANATKCAADKYVDANACLACPAGFGCDGTDAMYPSRTRASSDMLVA